MRTFFLAGLATVGWISTAGAQGLEGSIRRPAASVLFAVEPTVRETGPADSASAARRTHWQTGMLVGAGIGAVGLGAFLYALCEGLRETRESCLRPGLAGATIGAVIGGTVGALIGGQIPKAESVHLTAQPGG